MGSGADNSYELAGFGFKANRTRSQVTLNERMYWRILTETACNRFKWEGLPETVSPRFLELCLFRMAVCIFYNDPKYGYLALRGTGSGKWNMYDDPTKFFVTGNSFVSKELKDTECVPIWANYLRIPDIDVVSLYARRLAEIDQTIYITVKNMRVTKTVVTDENQRHSWSNLMRLADEGLPVIFASQALDMTQLQALDVGADYHYLSELMIARSRYLNDCASLLGINNANQDKKERLVTDEVAANDEQVASAKYINLNARQQACEKINKMFPELNVSVDYRADAEAKEEQENQLKAQKELTNNGNVHNDPQKASGAQGGNS